MEYSTVTSANAVCKHANNCCILGAAPHEAWKFLDVLCIMEGLKEAKWRRFDYSAENQEEDKLLSA